MKLIVLLFSSLVLLTACEGHEALQVSADNSAGIRGGEIVSAEDSVARKVFHLRVGYDKTQATNDEGATVYKWRVTTCTASALTPRILMTAAHCFPETTDLLNVDVIMPDGTKEIIRGQTYMTHRLYNKEDHTADLAMVLLETSLPEGTELVNLPSKGEDLGLTSIIAAGYGVTSSLVTPNGGTLRKTVLDVQKYDPLDEMIVVNQRGSSGACKGDSGSSALYEKDGVTYTVGVMSYANFQVPNGKKPESIEKCAFEANYVNVQFHLDWIHAVLKHWANE
ncbi:trypsin-like serine protease [Bdellovibrio sp. HCB2-146]|uniref:trypsin-like serine protease n=1 Tax=Bdellovibrio sp. HCB2-146 TaxID=3394362 RepID=UPI0039BCD1B5